MAEQLSRVHAKLDTLLTGAHEQVFRFFILVPRPAKGYMGKALQKMAPRNWLPSR